MKLDIMYFKLVANSTFEIARTACAEQVYQLHAEEDLKKREQIRDDTQRYLKAVWKMAENFPSALVYNKDLMLSAIDYIGSKNVKGENLNTTMVAFTKAYGKENTIYLKIANVGLRSFPKSYITPTKPTKKKRKITPKRIAVPKTTSAPKWTERLIMATIDTDKMQNAEIALCRKDDDKYISISNAKEEFLLPLDVAQSINVSIENAINKAQKLHWI